MDPNLKIVPAFSYKDLLLRKLYYPVTCSVLSQVVILQLYLFTANFNILHPIEWTKAAFSSMSYVSTWIFIICFLAVVFLQSVVCAKDYVINSSYSKNRFQKFISVFSIHNIILLTLHIVIGGILVWLFLSLGGGPYEHFVYPCKQNYCLNEGKFFLVLGGVWTGLYYFVKIYVTGRHLTFPVIHQRKLIQLKTNFIPLVKHSMYFATWPTLYFIVFYSFWGASLKNKISYSVTTDDEGDSIVWMYFSLWFMGTLYFISMNLMRFYFNLFLTEAIQFPLVKVTDNVLTLQDAILMENFPIVQNLACLDLYSLSCRSKPRRQLLFTLSQPGGHPHNWNILIANALKLFNDYTDLLNQSSKTISEKTVQPVANISAVYNSPITTDTFNSPPRYGNLRNMSLYCSPQIDKIVGSQQKNPLEVLQDFNIFKKISGKMNSFISVCKIIFGINYLFGELPQVDIQKCLANGNIIIWISQGIAELCIVSLKEDKYGVVQKDLPVILTSLVQLRQCLERLNKVPSLSKRIAYYDDYNYKMKNSILSAVKRSIYKLCLSFGEYIDDFPLPKDIMQQLQPNIVKVHE